MAERYGGKYSPDPRPEAPPPPGFNGRKPGRAAARVNFLFLVPLIFAVKAFTGPAADLAPNLGALGLLWAAAWLTREGIIAQEAYEARSIARRPAFPRKIFASVLTGAGLFLGGMVAAPTLMNPILFGLIGAGLHLLALGPDPLRDKGTQGLDPYQTDRVARAVDEGESYLAGMKGAIERSQDRLLQIKVDRFAETARQLFRTIEADPRDLTAARRDIGVFLMAARDATVKFADVYPQTRDPGARAEYEKMLADLDRHFRHRTAALLSNNHTDLGVEIEVLRDRLHLEEARLAPLPKPRTRATQTTKGDAE
jgi:hypothetical protein